jgi:hypothetical protein
MKRSFKIIIGIIGAFFVVVAAFFVFINIRGPLSDVSSISSDLETLSPRQADVGEFTVIAQPDAASCGITTISMIESFFKGQNTDPNVLIQKYQLTGGMKTDEFSKILSAELPDHEIVYKANLSDLEMIKEIHSQLSIGMPVAVFFGAENPYNKPFYDFHASVVTGMDLDTKTVDVANAYGYYETISLNDFLDRTSYSNTDKYPIIQKAVLKLGLMDKNAIFILKGKG